MPATPGRRTEVALNTPVTIPMQGAWWQDLPMGEISLGVPSSVGAGTMPTNPPDGNFQTTFLPHLGWTISQYQETLNYTHESTVTDIQDLDPAGWANTNVNTGIFGSNAHRFPSELPGIGTTTGATGPNDKYYEKLANAGDSIAIVNASDQAAYPSANAVGVVAPWITLDRIYTGTSNHLPNQDLWMRFYVPEATPFKTAQIILHLYFTGIPTYVESDTSPGTGQYALTLFADGTAIVQESFGPSNWVVRFRTIWCVPQLVAGHMHVVAIRTDAHQDSNGLWQGRIIQFRFDNTSAAGQGPLAIWQTAITQEQPGMPQTYEVIQVSPVQPTPQPIRLDVRRDIFCRVRLQTALYFTTGYLRIKTQESPLICRDPLGDPEATALNVTVYWTRGGTIDCNVYENSSTTALTQLGSPIVVPGGSVFLFQCPLSDTTNETFFNCVVTLNSNAAQTDAPLVKRITFVRDPILTQSTPTPLTVPVVSAISMSGPDRDVTHETLAFTAPDPTGTLDPILTNQAAQTVTVNVFYDETDPSKFSTVFQGRLASAKRRQRGNVDNVTGYPKWGTYDVLGVGEWSTWHKLKTTKVYNFAANQGGAFKVTDAMAAILGDNYLGTQFEIPDLPQAFFAQGNDSGVQTIESFTPIDALLSEWARFYLGAFWVWDANYTNGGGPTDTNGCWRLIVPPSPVGLNQDGLPGYNYVCQFLTERPPGTEGVPAEEPSAWPTIKAYNLDGSDMVQTFCTKFDFESHVIPPEGNVVYVTGIGAYASKGNTGGALGAWSGDVKLSRRLTNWPAANFGQNMVSDGHPLPDPTNPDYTDGIPNLIYYSDPALRTQAAVDFMARRIFDMSCHTQYFEYLGAPMIYIFPQPGDPKWIRPRPLRFGDPVLLNGKPMFVYSAPSGKWVSGRDKNQMAYYELRSIPTLTSDFSQSGTDEQWKGLLAMVA